MILSKKRISSDFALSIKFITPGKAANDVHCLKAIIRRRTDKFSFILKMIDIFLYTRYICRV